ncbi:hypothetical protein Vi05172_g7416 [Venturia inaequalis]|nr:hypothetical protein Vi05172_g7416 [Venturia inaequalis]
MSHTLQKKGPLRPLGTQNTSSSYTQSALRQVQVSSRTTTEQKPNNAITFNSSYTPSPFLDKSIMDRKIKAAAISKTQDSRR